ncbi:LuxR C-terminal-related transcriptional regulator [Microbacterium barkeri]
MAVHAPVRAGTQLIESGVPAHIDDQAAGAAEVRRLGAPVREQRAAQQLGSGGDSARGGRGIASVRAPTAVATHTARRMATSGWSCSQAGVPVDARLDSVVLDSLHPLMIELTARTLREGLTNASRHAPGAAVQVELFADGAEHLDLKVRWGASSRQGTQGSGHGIPSLQRRAALLGASVEAGAVADGFELRLRAPLRPVPRTDTNDRVWDAALISNSQETRRRILQSAAVPASVLGLAIVGILVVQAVTVTQTAIPSSVYEQIELGASRSELAPRLPAGIPAPPPIVVEEDAPPSTRVVILTTFGEDEYIERALGEGALGFLVKAADPRELIAGVRAVADGGADLSPTIARRVVAPYRGGERMRDAAAREALAGLTEREKAVLALLGAGASNAEIGAQLHLVEGTVKGHVSAILGKLGARNRVEAAVIAHRAGLVTAE